jgi:hypothetical protein
MSEKKMVGRNVAIALGIVCIILVAGIGGAMAYYTGQINNKNTDYNNYVSTHSYTNTQYDTLNSTYNNYVNDHHYTDEDYDSLQSQYNTYVADHHHTDEDYNTLNTDYQNLQSQYNSLNASYNYLNQPHLVSNLDATDNHPNLHVSGIVVNIGYTTASNSLLYVEGWQSAVLAFNTTITIGTVSYGSFVSVDSSITYTGSALTSWRVWSQPWGIDWTWTA